MTLTAINGSGTTIDRSTALSEAIWEVINAEAERAPLPITTIVGVLTIVQHELIQQMED